MTSPSFNDLQKYSGTPLTDSQWNFNFQKLVNWLTGATPIDVTFNNISAVGITASGTVSANAFTGNGAALTGVSGVPVGGVMAYAGTTDPTNFLICDGRSLLRSGTYASLFSAIGTAFGTVDGTHFNIPDLRGTFIRGLSMPDTTFNNTVDTTNDIITTPVNHTIRTGMFVRVKNSGGGLPGGLSSSTTYFTRYVSSTQFSLYDTREHAMTGGATGLINLTSDGTGTNKVYSFNDLDQDIRKESNYGSNIGNLIGSWQETSVSSININASPGAGSTVCVPNSVPTAGANFSDRPDNIYMNWVIRYA